jgi:hypothetical protein
MSWNTEANKKSRKFHANLYGKKYIMCCNTFLVVCNIIIIFLNGSNNIKKCKIWQIPQNTPKIHQKFFFSLNKKSQKVWNIVYYVFFTIGICIKLHPIQIHFRILWDFLSSTGIFRLQASFKSKSSPFPYKKATWFIKSLRFLLVWPESETSFNLIQSQIQSYPICTSLSPFLLYVS